MFIYKILTAEQWRDFRETGTTQGAPVDIEDGFIHFSTATQLAETAAKHFANQDNLFVLACDSERLDAELQWEPSRGGALFPHLYRALNISDIHWASPLPLENGIHQLPSRMEDNA